jgi:L-malate glycosyltransferase
MAGRKIRPLRILVLSDWFPESPEDAAGSFVRQQALAIAGRHEVSVLHLRRPVRGAGWPRLEETRDGPLRILRLHTGRVGAVTAVNLYALASALLRLRRDHAAPDVLHAHEMAGGLVAVIAGRVLRRPVVLSEHFSGFALDQVHGRAARIARLTFAGADVLCPVSESLRASLESGGWDGHLRVVPNVVDTELFSPAGSPPGDDTALVVAVAALEPVKGVEELIEAVAILNSRRSDFRLVLVGDGSLRTPLAHRAAELELEERLVLRGPLPHRDVAELMHRAAFAVVPSRWETFSVVLGEAMASGLPVVATAVGGMPERVHAGNGLLCPPREPQALAVALDTMLDSYGSYDRKAIAAEVRAAYSPAVLADRWEEVYAEAVARRRAVS